MVLNFACNPGLIRKQTWIECLTLPRIGSNLKALPIDTMNRNFHFLPKNPTDEKKSWRTKSVCLRKWYVWARSYHSKLTKITPAYCSHEPDKLFCNYPCCCLLDKWFHINVLRLRQQECPPSARPYWNLISINLLTVTTEKFEKNYS